MRNNEFTVMSFDSRNEKSGKKFDVDHSSLVA